MKIWMMFSVLFLGSMVSAKSQVELDLTVKDSKIVFDTKVDSFALKNLAENQSFECRESAISLESTKNVLKGWDPQGFDFDQYSKSKDGYASYRFATCRDAKTQYLIWFVDQKPMAKDGSFWGEISYFFIQKGFQLAKHDLVIEKLSLDKNLKTYFACKKTISRSKLSENEKFTSYKVSTTCDEEDAISSTGLADFIADPGLFAPILSYRGEILPAVTADQKKYEAVVGNLLKLIPEGTYTGVMSTLAKTCETKISFENGVLDIEQTMTVGQRRTRSLQLTADDLLGFVDGPVFKDPIRIEESQIGIMSAAQFKGKKGVPVTLRFEQNDTKDGLIFRINGSESYCRRLVRVH
jgi:hypothetical protein